SGGVPVAKHGNRAASSKSGAADCFEQLGVKIDLSPEENKGVLEKTGICFLFAQKYHPAMRFVAPVRKELGIRTIFNILGPLTNPAGATMQVMGVYDEALIRPLAEVIQRLGVHSALVVFGMDPLDEISLSDTTKVCEIRDGELKEYEISPEMFGYDKCDKSDLVGGTPEENAKITRDILEGREKGAKRNAVVLNAGAGLYVARKADTLKDGAKMAEELIDSGAALKKLEEFIAATNA
ncbi:MAG: anthranilate phosphoribosyltransferase, partial [Lachnospiraceae bacterium]|nr:anthranilate phosphoribosyltransferase [Lachnospiraceae bacterium]